MTLPGIWPLRRVRVTGPSMVPALRDGDQVVVRMGAGARPGDVVVVDLPERPLSVKRLVRRRPDGHAVNHACLVSKKIFEISSILPRSCSATAGSVEPLAPLAPASFVASLNSWCSSGYFSKCGGLK